MFYIIGCVIFWIYIGIVFWGVNCFKDKVKKSIDIVEKYVQMIVGILMMSGGYLLLFTVLIMWKSKGWILFNLVSTLALIIMWKLVYIAFSWIWLNNEKDTNGVDKIQLSQNEKNWCNTISILGMCILGIVWAIQKRGWEYLDITGTSIAIWLASYILIQSIQNDHTKKRVLEDLKQNFRVERKSIIFAGALVILLFIFFNSLEVFAYVAERFNELLIGVAIGAFLFVIGVMIIKIIKNTM